MSKVTEKRRVGRPRASGNQPSADPEKDILQAAAKLFSERGFVGTSTRQIASAAGLRQSAIFHWFPSKESILEKLFSKGWDRSLDYFKRIGDSALPGAVKLCLSLTYDARFVAGADPYIQVMIVPPELRQPRFKRLLIKRQRLISYFEEFIRQAIVEGDFRDIPIAEAARMVLAIDEVVLDAAKLHTPLSPQKHASTAVDFVLHALVCDRARVAKIMRTVAERAKQERTVPDTAAAA